LLGQEEGLLDQVERRLLPARVLEAVVLRQRLDAGRRLRVAGRPRGPDREPQRLARRLVGELRLLAGRKAEVDEPVDVGARQDDRRDAAGQPAERRVQRAVERLEGLRGRARRLDRLGRRRRPRRLGA
jgi:hypothetical protein